jgi:AraC-like DNA-binding protein
MANQQPHRIKTIAEWHQFRYLPKPEHPLVSVINFNAKMKYGQQQYDFDEGVMFFISPGQVFSIEANKEIQHTGWSLLVHPDFLWNTPLAQKIKQYEYFSYAVHEALHLSEKEETMIAGIMQNIEQEYHANIDKFSQDVIIAQLELLLTYSERFYNRQFITRKITNHQILDRLEDIITNYFSNDDLMQKGLITVQYVAEALNVSPGYLSGMLKVLTGQSTQQHIHDKLIARAKEKLSTSDLSVSEIAYELGFEHSQSFSKLFKTKTNQSPLEFRQSFN